jgi:hypothetical protein
MRFGHAAWIVSCVVLGVLPGEPPRRWTFDGDAPGAIAPGFSGEVGRWVVEEADGGNRVLAQQASSARAVFNVALVSDTNARDLELTVRFRAVAGQEDQGGGLVWRARDAKNYDIARFNPLEDNFRVYKVVAGQRTQLGTVDVKRPGGWHTLTVRMIGDQIVCVLDRTARLEVRDATFPDAGKIGLWTKADARTQFDDLELTALAEAPAR